LQKGAVYIIDDDIDDHQIVKEIWKDLGLPNQLLFFTSGADMMMHLSGSHVAPFLIICDLNLPKMNGFELRTKLLESANPKFKSVPFIFWSTHASEAQVREAYELSAHGFFIKGSSFTQMKESFTAIINYWALSEMPAKS
jgi:DNA-binding NarL/FixJ family response regulator